MNVVGVFKECGLCSVIMCSMQRNSIEYVVFVHCGVLKRSFNENMVILYWNLP